MKNKLFLILMILPITMLFSQVTTSSLKGVVYDETNEVLMGVNVVVIHTPTGTT